MSWLVIVSLAIAALCTSVLSAILGMAGGISLLGVMTALLAARDVVPLHGVVQLSSNFTRTLAFAKHIHWKIFALFAPAAIPGLWLASQLWSGSKLTWFKPFIGLFILLFLVWRRYKKSLRNPPLCLYPFLGFFTGALSIFVGATGPFLAPFFLRDDFENERVIATKAACQFWLHLFKIPAFMSLGYAYSRHSWLLGILIVCVIAGTLLGKRILTKVPKKAFTFAFETTLSLIALYLVLGSSL